MRERMAEILDTFCERCGKAAVSPLAKAPASPKGLRRLLTKGGELVSLSRTEWLLLQHLAAHAGKVVLHTELLTKVWGPEYRDDLQYLRVWVSRVRRKLGAEPGEPGRIKTFQGIGYLLDVEPPAAAPMEPQMVKDERSAMIG